MTLTLTRPILMSLDSRMKPSAADLRRNTPISTGGNFNLTVQSRIARTPKLAALAAGMRRHEQQFVAEARAKAKAEIEAAKKNLESLEATATILRDEIRLGYTLCRPHGLRDDSDYKPYRNHGPPIERLEPT
jgi:hypothetical protein